MTICVNGKSITLEEKMNITALLEHEGYIPETIVVERNEKIVSKDEYDSIFTEEGDVIEILRFVGGGQ